MERERNISPTWFDEQLPNLKPPVLALPTQWMAYYQSVTGGVCEGEEMRCCSYGDKPHGKNAECY